MIEWGPLIANGAVSLGKDVLKTVILKGSDKFQEQEPYKKLTFDDHFKITFNRCTKIKTIVNGDAPVNLLDQYINLNFDHSNSLIDDYALIDKIWEHKSVVISGPAGCGKSMFMRYLWISCFVNTRGKIPLFIELRHLNGIGVNDFIAFLFAVCAPSASADARRLFDAAIEEGQFFFIFDGFDELSIDKKNVVEPEILRLSRANKNIVVVSGRHDDRFDSWQSFLVYNVAPLSKLQSISLIEKIDFDQTIKSNFIKKIKVGTYDKHQDFLSRPLLVTMMLLTYNAYGEIPYKIHVFYDQAFDTLFSRHDATKEAFRRVRNTDYAIHDFKRIFGLFCLLTYRNQKSDFTESELLEYIDQVASVEKLQINSTAFLRDLIESVCVVQKEGLFFVFSHRSFQEYFCAYGLGRLAQEQAKPLMRSISLRVNDNVFNMLFDMNRSFFEDTYFSPSLQSYAKDLKLLTDSNNIRELIVYLSIEIGISYSVRNAKKRKESALYVHSFGMNEKSAFLFWIAKLYPSQKRVFSLGIEIIDDDLAEFLLTGLNKIYENTGLMIIYNGQENLQAHTFDDNPKWQDISEYLPKFIIWLEASKWSEKLRKMIRDASKFSDQFVRERQKQTRLFQEITKDREIDF